MYERLFAAASLLGCLAVLCLAGASPAATLRVPEDYPSVLAAGDAAGAGDSVLVGPGTWTEMDIRSVVIDGQVHTIRSCAFLRPGITVIGVEGAEATSVGGNPTAHGFILVAPGDRETVIEGFSIEGAANGVLAAGGASLEVRRCRIVDNLVFGGEHFDATVVYRDCFFEGNTWNDTTPGQPVIYAVDTVVEFHGCEFRRNAVGKAMRVNRSDRVVVDGCSFVGLEPVGACLFQYVDDLQVRNSRFVGIVSTGTGAGLTFVSCSGHVEYCTFVRGNAVNGGGIFASSSQVGVHHNTFFQCDGGLGAAIAISGSDPGVHHNIIAHSTGFDGAVIRGSGSNHPDTGCNIFWANECGDFSTYGTWTPAPTDIFADPQFCAPALDDLTLRSSSPGAPDSPACGAVGAHPVGCGPTSVDPMSWGRIKNRYRPEEGQP